jgi:hypothetical protein
MKKGMMMSEEFKERTASLIVWGIFQLFGGVLCALLAVFTFIPLMVLPSEVAPAQVIPGMLVYVFLAVGLIWSAIGTIRARRWAQRLMLAASWLMLACGILAMGMMAFILPRSFEAVGMQPEIIKGVLIFTYTLLVVLYLLIPGLGILFYGNRNIRATIEHRDPGPSWTDQCPLPVLILVVLLVLALVSFLMLMFMNCAVPFFGIIITGWQGAIVLLGCVAGCLLLAFGVYKLRQGAWWGMLVLLVLGCASQLITYRRIELLEYYDAMGYTDQIMQSVQKMDWLNGAGMSVMAMVYALPGLIYLLWVKRYFDGQNKGENDD